MVVEEGDRLADYANAVRQSTLKRLLAVPRGKENWRPVTSALSIGEIASHIIDADQWLFRKLREPKIESMTAKADVNVMYSPSEFQKLVVRLEDLGHQRSTIIRDMSRSDLLKLTYDQRFGGDVQVWWVIVRGNLDHETHHRGQLAAYLHILKNEETN